MGIHPANSFLDTSLLGQGLRYYKPRQEASSALFPFGSWSLVCSSQRPQNRGTQGLSYRECSPISIG